MTLNPVDYPNRQYHLPPDAYDTPKRGSVASVRTAPTEKSSRSSTLVGEYRHESVSEALKRRDSHLSSTGREQEDALAHFDDIMRQNSSTGSLADHEEPAYFHEVHSGSGGTLKSSRASTFTGHHNGEEAYVSCVMQFLYESILFELLLSRIL